MDTYKKKYKEIVGKIRKAYLYAQTDSTKAVLEDIFPELAESEGEKVREELIKHLKEGAEGYEPAGCSSDYQRWLAWLEKQNGNIGGNFPNSEWSEEDEQHIDSLLKRLDALCRIKLERTRFAISEDIDWLKSLRPQNKWKPSNEQMGLLQAIINEPKNAASESCQIILKDILEQLKKLKEGKV